MLLHTRIENVGLVGVETRRTLPLSACRTMCQLQGCNCTPGSQALGLWASIRGEPFLCLHDETFLHRMGACGTMLHHLRTGASHITVLHRVGACGTMLHHLRKGALHVTAAYVCGPLLQRESKPYYRDANLVNSTRRAPPGRWHHVAASVAAVGAADVLPRRAHNEQQEKHECTS